MIGSDTKPTPAEVNVTDVIVPFIAVYTPLAPPAAHPPPRKMRLPDFAVHPLPPEVTTVIALLVMQVGSLTVGRG